MNSTLSLTEATARTGLSRWPISRALQAARLRGTRDNRGRWRIDAEDLERWTAEHQRAVPHAEPHSASTVHPLAVEVASLRARLEGAEARASELARERDEARADGHAMRELLVAALARPERPSFLDRLLGRLRKAPATA